MTDPDPERLSERFRELTGRQPAAIWRAPGRVNLIGEHTDYNDGFVLPFAIDRFTDVAIGRRTDGRIRCWSEQRGPAPDASVAELDAARGDDWGSYVRGVAWALLEEGVDVPGVDLVVDSTLPAGAGLSSSAALEVAVAAALAGVAGVTLAPLDLARAARRAENDYVGVPCGVMDQTVVSTAQPGYALFLDTRTLAHAQVRLWPETDATLVVIDTRTEHRLVDGAYAERRRACEEAARALGVSALRDTTPADLDRLPEALAPFARHVVTENARVLDVVDALKSSDLSGIAAAINASHTSLRDDFQVSSPELDLAVDAALAAGALGARMVGAGFGGSAIAICTASAVADITRQARAAFSLSALDEPSVFEVRSRGGVSRLY